MKHHLIGALAAVLCYLARRGIHALLRAIFGR
jgi:hypothetical protein